MVSPGRKDIEYKVRVSAHSYFAVPCLGTTIVNVMRQSNLKISKLFNWKSVSLFR